MIRKVLLCLLVGVAAAAKLPSFPYQGIGRPQKGSFPHGKLVPAQQSLFPHQGIGRPQHGSFPLDKLEIPSFPPEGIGRPQHGSFPLDKLEIPSFPPEGIGRPQHGSFPLDKLGVPSFPHQGIGRPQHGSFGDHFHNFVPVDPSEEHGGPPPGSAPGGIVSSFRPPRPQQGFPPPGSAPGGIISSFRPPKPQQGSPPPGSAPGGIVSSFRPPKPSRPFKPAGPTGSGLRPGIAPGEGRPVIPILVDERDGPHADGTYSFNFETGNGISRQEQGYPQGPQGAVESQGGWSFTFPDGTPGVFNFVADENGYRIESDLLPTPHPLPAHALAQIEFARQQEAQVKPQSHGDYGR